MFKQFNKRILPQLNIMWYNLQGLLNMQGDPYINVKRAGKGVALSINIAALRSRIVHGGGGGSGGDTRRALCTADAGATNEIAATLFNSDGTTGDAITVYCNISNGDTPPGALNEASPRLEKDVDVIYVKSIYWDDGGTPTQRWECVTNFMATEDCDCVQPDHVFNSIAVASDEKISLDGVLDGDTFIRHNSADSEVEHAVEGDTVTTW